MYRYLNLVLAAAGLLGGATFATAAHAQSATCDTPTTPFCAATAPLPANWTGHVFALSQDYPASAPQDVQPWLAFDPTTQPGEYLKTVFDYFYDGNIRNDAESSFDPKLNSKRMWFHAPWQDAATDTNTREPIHGLTRERVSRAAELASQQTHEWNNYAVGFYNAPGGVVIGQVWADHGNPDRSKAKSFPEGTVAAKLSFTTAPVSEVPYLKGSPEWDAYVYADPNDPRPNVHTKRAVLKVRLLQIDIAVKDSRVASSTGWVFGTFVYGGGPNDP
jgi:hypothetical protein